MDALNAPQAAASGTTRLTTSVGASTLAPATDPNAGPAALRTAAGATSLIPMYETAHTLNLPDLKSNTTYQATISAQTKDGTQLSQQVQFTTAKERIRVTIDQIDIFSGGAFIGDPSPLWLMGVQWASDSDAAFRDQALTCFPTNGAFPNGICQYGSYGDGAFQPLNTFGKPLSGVFAEENFDSMPTRFRFAASADISSGILNGVLGIAWDVFTLSEATFNFPQNSAGSWDVPRGVETSTTSALADANTGDGLGFYSGVTYRAELFFDNSDYPAPQRNRPSNPWANDSQG
jgi:hypothetical protein